VKKESAILVRVEHPTKAELAAAYKAMRARGNLCGCFTQASRNPFYSGLLAHYRIAHPDSLAILAEVQAQVLMRLARELVPEHDWPWPTRSMPIPVWVGEPPTDDQPAGQ
jgi:hypothetical protein